MTAASSSSAPNPSPTPRHVAIIPDGNRRWAKARGLSVKDAHQAGYDNLKKTADLAFARGIEYLTGYVFSTENWSRTQEEVGFLMSLAGWAIRHEAAEFSRKGIRIKIVGSRHGLDARLDKGLSEVERLTADGKSGTINICFNYGGRRDIVEAVNRLLESRDRADALGDGGTPAARNEREHGGIPSPKLRLPHGVAVDEQTFPSLLSTAGIPDPDLIIRTSGERRLSNYLIWEGAYSELYFTDALWPDFDEAELDRALVDYAARKRRFGK